MDRTIDRADIEEYEEIVGNFGQYSDRVEPENAQAVPIQEPTSIQREILMTRTDPGIYKWDPSRNFIRDRFRWSSQ